MGIARRMLAAYALPAFVALAMRTISFSDFLPTCYAGTSARQGPRIAITTMLAIASRPR